AAAGAGGRATTHACANAVMASGPLSTFEYTPAGGGLARTPPALGVLCRRRRAPKRKVISLRQPVILTFDGGYGDQLEGEAPRATDRVRGAISGLVVAAALARQPAPPSRAFGDCPAWARRRRHRRRPRLCRPRRRRRHSARRRSRRR